MDHQEPPIKVRISHGGSSAVCALLLKQLVTLEQELADLQQSTISSIIGKAKESECTVQFNRWKYWLIEVIKAANGLEEELMGQ